jgi:hypothetical protein
MFLKSRARPVQKINKISPPLGNVLQNFLPQLLLPEFNMLRVFHKVGRSLALKYTRVDFTDSFKQTSLLIHLDKNNGNTFVLQRLML